MHSRNAKGNLNRQAGSLRKTLPALALIFIFTSVPGQVASSLLTAATPKVSLSQPLTVRWRYASSATLNLTPATDNDRIYLPLAGGSIVSLSANEGQLYWKSEVGGEFSASPAADNRALYVASETTAAESANRPATGSLRALGREAGVTLWLKTLPVPIRGSLAMSDERIFAGASNGGFYSIDKATGNVVWFVQVGSAFNCSPVISSHGVYV